MAYVLPLIMAAYQANASSTAARFNAGVAANEQKSAIDQGNAAANIQTRSNREALGRQAAAFGAAGVGYGGSSEGALDESAINEEQDVLNTRYRGILTGAGYGVQAGLETSDARNANIQGSLMAGNALLKGLTNSYSNPSEMSVGGTTDGSLPAAGYT